MLLWAGYLLVFSAVLSLAALTLERALRRYGCALRWIWAGALLCSLALPFTLACTRTRPQAAPQSRAPAAEILPRAALHLPRRVAQQPPGPALPESVNVNTLFGELWALSSASTALVLLAGVWYARRRQRRWQRAWVRGTELFVAKDAGPATVGLLRPAIVLPEWLLCEKPGILELVIAHERCHVEARDPGLLGLAFGLATLTPWNPFVWWLLHRLRLALEVDCDRRVLHAGHDARRYARALVDVSMRRPAYVGGVAASPGSLSLIERRIILMTTPRLHGWRPGPTAGALLSIGIATAAVLILPPAMPPALAAIAGRAAPHDLARYVGSYQTSTMTVLRIGLRDGRLTATFPGSEPQLLTRAARQVFRFPNVDADLRFVTDDAGHVRGLVMRQNGAATEAPRIGVARERAIDSKIHARVHAQSAAPGSRAALRELIAGIESGHPHYADLSPQLAAGTRALLPKLKATLERLGPLLAIEFRGVAANGWDQYQVRFQHGTASCGIALDAYGLVVGAGLVTHPAPHTASSAGAG